jgi:hypothetical protein
MGRPQPAAMVAALGPEINAVQSSITAGNFPCLHRFMRQRLCASRLAHRISAVGQSRHFGRRPTTSGLPLESSGTFAMSQTCHKQKLFNQTSVQTHRCRNQTATVPATDLTPINASIYSVLKAKLHCLARTDVARIVLLIGLRFLTDRTLYLGRILARY